MIRALLTQWMTLCYECILRCGKKWIIVEKSISAGQGDGEKWKAVLALLCSESDWAGFVVVVLKL